MTESATSMRPISGAEEFDRRMRSLTQASTPHSDALAELARLVGQQDPFRDVSAETHEASPAEAPLAVEPDFTAFAAGLRKSGVLDGAADGRGQVDDSGWDHPVPRYPSISVRDRIDREPSPDAWAEGAAEQADDTEVVPEPEAAPGSSAKRTLIVLAAVVALTGGGLAASFLARPSGAAVSTATTAATPTIMAAAGPSKVQPETPPSGADAPTQPSTLLDKNNNDGTAAAKVVNTIEQPVDLAQAVKPAAPSADAAADTAPPAAASSFPEPHKVKTVLVRPDGSIIADAPAAAATDVVGSTANQQANLAFDPTTSLPIAPPSAEAAPPAPAVPDTAPATAPAAPVAPPRQLHPVAKPAAQRAAPKPAASTTQSGSATAQARTSVATPKAKPVVHAPPKPKPAAVAAAAPEAAPAAPDVGAAPAADATAAAPAPVVTGAGGTYAIQLGAAPTEAEAQDAAKQMEQKYGLPAKPLVIKASAGGKTVYRIRVGRLSGDDAKAVCAKIQGSGGACFIAHK